MNFFAASALINAITSLILGAFVFERNPKGKTNSAFALFALSAFCWSFPYYLWQISSTEEMALLWSRVLMAGAIFIPVTYLHFTYALVDILKKRRKFLIASYLLFSLFFFVNFTPFFVSHVEPLLNFRFWPIAGTAYHAFLILWTFYAYYAAYVLLKEYKQSKGLARLQLKYVALGTLIGYTGGITNYFLWYRIPILPIGNITASIYLLLVAYAIIRYRLMDIRVVLRKIFIYLGSAVFAYGFFYLVIWFYNSAFEGVFSTAAYAVGLVVAPLFVFTFYSLDKGLRVFANRYLFVSLYNYQETINKLTDELNHYIDLNKIIDLIVDTIKQTMQLNRAGVLLVNTETNPVHYDIAKVIGFNRSNGISLVQDNFLTQYLQKTQKPLVLDELELLARYEESRVNTYSFKKLHEHMSHIEASLCLPLLSSDKLIGIVVLGAKITGDAYTKEDLELLNTLSKQAGVAIENARLYAQVQEFNQKLEQEVDKATADLKKTNFDLEEAIKVKNEFLQIASHQLRTPVSVMRGVLDTLLTDTGTLTPEQRQEFLKRAFLKSEKLSQVVDDVLSATEMDTPDFNIAGTAKPVSLRELAEKAVTSHVDEAKDHGLTLALEADEPGPMVFASETFLPQAITNLVDNAIKYTEKGAITVKVYVEGDQAVLAVTDSGMGVPPDDLSNLWDKFKRAKNAKDMHTDGSGLGLFIIKKIIQGHEGGSVFAESVLGQGSTFGFELPVMKNESKS